MSKYRAIEPIKHEDGIVAPGEVFELADRHAKQLLDMGHIEPADKAAAKAAEKTAAKSNEAAEGK